MCFTLELKTFIGLRCYTQAKIKTYTPATSHLDKMNLKKRGLFKVIRRDTYTHRQNFRKLKRPLSLDKPLHQNGDRSNQLGGFYISWISPITFLLSSRHRRTNELVKNPLDPLLFCEQTRRITSLTQGF